MLRIAEPKARRRDTVVFWYRMGSVHGLLGITEPKVRVCVGTVSGGTWITSDTKTWVELPMSCVQIFVHGH